MTEKSTKGTANTAYGKKLDTPVDYSYSWKAYENIDEVKAANDLLTDDEIVKVRNDQRQLSARNKAQVEALKAAGYEKPTLETDEQLRLREMFKVLMSSKRYSEDEARNLASTTLGIDWAE